MVTDLRGAGRPWKMSEIIKCGKKFKLFSFFNQTAISFDIFSEH